MVTGVKESKSGTMTETEGRKSISPQGRKAISPSEEVKTPEVASKVSQEEEQPIYTQRQADALIHATKSEITRQFKDIETERDNLRSQIKTKGSELEDIQAERESLETKIDDLTSDDPKKFDLIKRDRELRIKERDLKSKLSGLDERETKLSEREKKVNSFEREVLIETIADEYEDGDAAKLKNAISGFENPTEEQIRTIADIFWKKKAEEEDKKPRVPKPYSGRNEGGSPYFTRSQIADREFYLAHKEDIEKASKEPGQPRIRD